MKVIQNFRVALLVLLVSCSMAQATELPEIEGVFGLDNINAQTCLAVWVPIEEGAVVSGVRWFQNDGNTEYPEILAQAGLLEWPGHISDAVSLVQNVSGTTSSWSEVVFPQPITADSAGLYLFFRLPEGSGFLHNGANGGFGLGFQEGSGVRSCWLTGNNEDWNPMAASSQMAVEPILDTNKAAGDVLVLRLADNSQVDLVDDERPIPHSAVASLVAYPNPFNPQTELKFVVPSSGHVSLCVFDLRGRLVCELLVQHLEEGQHQVTWDGRNSSGSQAASGVYFARLEAGLVVLKKQLIMLK
ncbi:MAG: T9SS type A sorting domain-containing protein [bacterium]|nr:T9SS type A sorting domain-containing protein [bacterium]